MMKMLSRRRLSRKLIRCRDLISGRNKCEAFSTREKSEEEEEEEAGLSWLEELPDDAMQVILQQLPPSDYLNCRYISPRWRAAIDSRRWLPAAHYQIPWVVTSSWYGGRDMLASYIKADDDDDDNLRIVINRKIYKPKNGCRDFYCVGSIAGWLIITNGRPNADGTYIRSFFCNPVSGARVKLPSHYCQLYRYSIIPTVKMVASSVPTTKTCYVTYLHFEYRGHLAFCTPTNKSWIRIKTEQFLEFRDIEILDGKLYALGSNALEFLMVFDIHLDPNGGRISTYSSLRLVTLHPNLNNIVDDGIDYRKCYSAKCCESKDLFMVLYKKNGLEVSFQVLKLEYKDGSTSTPQWVEIADLGDRALFMGTRNSKFITCHDKTLERNCIYFVLSRRGEDYTSGVFSLTDRSFKPITHPYKSHLWIPKHHSTWFTPSPC